MQLMVSCTELKNVASNLKSEAARIKAKFLKACFPRKVIVNTISNYNNLLCQDGSSIKEKQL